jgi:hypothetical protein
MDLGNNAKTKYTLVMNRNTIYAKYICGIYLRRIKKTLFLGQSVILRHARLRT